MFCVAPVTQVLYWQLGHVLWMQVIKRGKQNMFWCCCVHRHEHNKQPMELVVRSLCKNVITERLPEAPRADNAFWDDECTSSSAISSILAALLHLLRAAIVSSTWHNTGWNLQLRASTSEEEADTASSQIWQICRNNKQWKCCRSNS